MGSGYVYLELEKNGKLWSGENSNLTLVLYDSSGSDANISESTAEVGATGLYIGTLPLTGLSDGWYLALWTHTKNRVWKAQWIYVHEERMIEAYCGLANEAMYIKLPTNYIMGSGDQNAHSAELVDWADGGRLDTILDACKTIADDWTNAGRLDTILDTIAEDTTTDLPALIGTPTGADLVADITSVLNQAKKLDAAAMTAPSSVTANSLADYILNKDGSKTYDKSTDSLEAVRDRGDSAWGSSGTATYDISVYVNASGATHYLTIIPRKNGQVYTATTLNAECLRAVPGGTMYTEKTYSEAATNADGVFDLELGFTPEAGKLYIIKGTLTMDGASRTVADGFVAFSV